MNKIVSQEHVENRILIIRGKKVLLDKDLAMLYGVSTKRLNEQVRRNIKRFPSDFMFKLTAEEVLLLRPIILGLRSQIATLNEPIEPQIVTKRGTHIKYRPYAFTEQGVAMLSSVLNSERAINVNILIMRAFVKLGEVLSIHKEFAHKLAELEHKVGKHDEDIKIIFEAIRQLMAPPPEKPKPRIGFHP